MQAKTDLRHWERHRVAGEFRLPDPSPTDKCPAHDQRRPPDLEVSCSCRRRPEPAGRRVWLPPSGQTRISDALRQWLWRFAEIPGAKSCRFCGRAAEGYCVSAWNHDHQVSASRGHATTNVSKVETTFVAEGIVFGINPSLAGYKDAQIDSFYRDLQGRLTETPGVKSASYSMVPLLSGALMATMFNWPGTPQDRQLESDVLEVGPDFVSTMQLPFVAGRGFDFSGYGIAAQARQSLFNGSKQPAVPTPVIVDQAFVAKFLGKENPLGKRFGQSAASQEGPASPGYEIIGVVRDTKYSDLRREISPKMYVPLSALAAAFEVRTAGDPQALVPVIRHTVAQLDPNLPLRDVTTESQQIDRLLFQERLVARLSSFFGLLALTLACIGLYGLLAYEVARRTREIGIRTALGAQRGDVLRLVVKQGLSLALAGAVVGIGASMGVTRYLKSMLYDVKADDPVTIAVVGTLLVLVALAACFLPAQRATNVDPMVALRYE